MKIPAGVGETYMKHKKKKKGAVKYVMQFWPIFKPLPPSLHKKIPVSGGVLFVWIETNR
jgi:hypothetical protein